MDVFSNLPYFGGPRTDHPFKPVDHQFTLSTDHWTLHQITIPADLSENGPHYIWFDENSKPYVPVIVSYEAKFQIPAQLYTPTPQNVSSVVYVVRN